MPVSVEECIVCNSESYNKDDKATFYLNLPKPYKVSKCTKCGFRWLNPRPTDKEYEKIFKASYLDNKAQSESIIDGFLPPARSYKYSTYDRETWHRSCLRRLKPHLPSARKVLDIGAASGNFLATARLMDWEIRGLEMSRAACVEAREKYGIELDNTSLAKFDSKGDRFDVVRLSHVLEHSTDPVGDLNRINQLVGEGGLVVIEVPNHFISWTSKFIDWRKGQKQRPRTLGSLHCPYFYSAKHLKRLLERSGFEVLHTRNFFSERWSGGPVQKGLMLIDMFSSIFGRGRNVEVIARRW